MICENCIHKEVCGLEGYYDEAVITCAHKTEFIPMSVIEEIKREIDTLSDNEYFVNLWMIDVKSLIDRKVKEYTDGNNNRSTDTER